MLVLHVIPSFSNDDVVVNVSISSISQSDMEEDTVDEVASLLVEASRNFGERTSALRVVLLSCCTMH